MDNFLIASPEWDSPRRRLTAHGRARCRQRGVRETDVDLIVSFGDVYHAGSGDVAYFIGWRAASRARAVAGMNIDHLRNTAVVVLSTGEVRTLFRQERPRRWWKRSGRRSSSTRGRWKGGKSWR